MTIQGHVRLGDLPTNEDFTNAIETMRAGGAVSGEEDTDGSAWALTVARFVNKLGPDTTDRFGRMRWERICASQTAPSEAPRV